MPDTEAAPDTAQEATTSVATTPDVASAPAPASAPPGGNGADADATDVPAFWPDEWRERMASGDEKMLSHLKRFASPEGVYKSWRQYERQRNDGRLQRARPDNGDEKSLAEWRKEIGAPDTPEGYAAALNAEIQVSDADAAALSRIFKTMHEQGLPTGQANAVVAEYYKMVAEGEEARVESDRQARMRAEDELHSEWGPDFRPNLNSIGVLFDSHASPELFNRLNEARFSDGTKLADDPGIMKFLAGVAREVHPDGHITITPTAGMSRGDAVSNEIQQLEQEMRDTRGRDPGGYWNSESKQIRYRELLTARDRMSARGR